MIEDHKKLKRKFNSVEEVDISAEVKCAEPLQDLWSNNVCLTQIPIVINRKYVGTIGCCYFSLYLNSLPMW